MSMFERWLTEEEEDAYVAEHGYDKTVISIAGGFFNFRTHGMRWGDYINRWKPHFRWRLESLRREVLRLGLDCCGDVMQDQYNPLFDDGKIIGFTCRAWGDFLAAVWSTEDDRDYSYLHFAWTGFVDGNPRENYTPPLSWIDSLIALMRAWRGAT